MSLANKDVVRSFFETQDRENRTPLELLSPDFTAHVPGTPPLDAQGFDEREGTILAAFSNVRHLIEDMLTEDDRVAFRMTMKMTHTGEFMGIPGSNNEITFGAIGIIRIHDGKIAEFWGSPDALGLMQQVGAIPSPGQAAAG